jgi:cytoskeletal protein RodZ
MPLLSRQDRREAAESAGYLLIGAVVLVVIAFIIGALVWALGVFSSGTKGRGDVIKQNNSSTNQIQAQAEFNKLWGDIQSYHADITASAAALAKNPGDAYQQSVLTAQQQICRSAVQEYNADTVNTTMREWRPAADPAAVDPTLECETTP